jgi:hypothetical protein
VVLLVALGLGLGAGCSDDGAEALEPGSREAFCAELRTAVEQHLTVFDPLDPVTPGDTTAALQRLAEAAPPELQPDVVLLADAFADVSEVLADVDPADAEAVERLEELDLDEDEIAAAQTAVTDYAADTCAINLQAINDASVPTTTVPRATVPPATAPPTTLAPTTVAPTTTVPA